MFFAESGVGLAVVGLVSRMNFSPVGISSKCRLNSLVLKFRNSCPSLSQDTIWLNDFRLHSSPNTNFWRSVILLSAVSREHRC